ncbi:hypothetical protein D6821_02255 [Candidatus Parcubacteria bacterium]|nr:MAG: hypothetical protein D6821_02255 [Candidatus Parcubacteria bacterium]
MVEPRENQFNNPPNYWQENSVGIHYAGGNVGIGTTNPDQMLTVASDGAKIKIDGVTDSGELQLTTQAIYPNYWAWYAHRTFGDLNLWYGPGGVGGNILTIKKDTGNVGIGTANPQSTLDVNGTIRAQQICDEGGGHCIDLSAGGGGSNNYVIVEQNRGSKTMQGWKCFDINETACDVFGGGCDLKMTAIKGDGTIYNYSGVLDYYFSNPVKTASFSGSNQNGDRYPINLDDGAGAEVWSHSGIMGLWDCQLNSGGSCSSLNDDIHVCYNSDSYSFYYSLKKHEGNYLPSSSFYLTSKWSSDCGGWTNTYLKDDTDGGHTMQESDGTDNQYWCLRVVEDDPSITTTITASWETDTTCPGKVFTEIGDGDNDDGHGLNEQSSGQGGGTVYLCLGVNSNASRALDVQWTGTCPSGWYYTGIRDQDYGADSPFVTEDSDNGGSDYGLCLRIYQP